MLKITMVLWLYSLHFQSNFCPFKKMHHNLMLNKTISISAWSHTNPVKLFIRCISYKTIPTLFCTFVAVFFCNEIKKPIEK